MTTNEPESEDGPIGAPEPAYPNSATWVARWLCPNLEREIKRTFEWCPQWWDHPEAVQRLEALLSTATRNSPPAVMRSPQGRSREFPADGHGFPQWVEVATGAPPPFLMWRRRAGWTLLRSR